MDLWQYGIFKDDIDKDIEYIDYLTAEYKGRIRFYLKEEKKTNNEGLYNRF